MSSCKIAFFHAESDIWFLFLVLGGFFVVVFWFLFCFLFFLVREWTHLHGIFYPVLRPLSPEIQHKVIYLA